MARKRPMFGNCLLTGKSGLFVKSHILPKALTKPERKGGIFFQAGDGSKPQKRRTSWYDSRICTAEGEETLAKLDDFAIKELRRLRLIWSGFGPIETVEPDSVLEYVYDDRHQPKGIRIIQVSDFVRLERWFASLLWRAAVSELPEMKNVSLKPSKIDQLTNYILGKTLLNPYPVSLTQLNTIGSIHNQTPTAATIRPSSSTDIEPWRVFRFYLDGLIIHFHRDEKSRARMGKLILGEFEECAVVCIPFSASFQAERLHGIMQETFEEFSKDIPFPKAGIE